MTEVVYHERLKSPIPRTELNRRTAELQKAMKAENIDCVLTQNLTQYVGSCNRWLTDTIAENNYPQSSILPADGEVRYIACSGPPLDLYPPSHLLRIGKPLDAAPYFAPFNYTHDWEGIMFVKWAKENNIKRIGVPGLEMLTWNYYDYIVKNLPGVEIVDISSMFDELRAIKSADEIEFLEKSAKVLDKVMAYVPAFAQPGVREYELRSRLMKLTADLGGEEKIVIIGSAPRGEKFDELPSFFQNRTLQLGDQLYVKLECSGPGGMFTTLGRMFSVGCEPSEQMKEDWEEVVFAQEKLANMLEVGSVPQTIYAQYNEYLESLGYKTETGLFAYGVGYDHVERPSIQPGETMNLNKDMVMGLNTSLVSNVSTIYCADTFIIKADGAKRMTQTPQTILRT